MEVFDFKCKYCGGELDEIQGLKSVGKCKYCGSKQTLPKLHDEKRANLFSRANHMRRNNEFDKAEVLYEQILNDDPSDPEAYWSLILCRFGIEYVEEGNSGERKTTVNRTQFTSIFADEDYKSAIKYADSEQKKLYEKEAKEINEIQKRILEISHQEEPFDVFICYKESDEKGQRTQDSVLAHDLYRELTRDGYKVFFARETLHDKIGLAYEPYIFSALNSAKVMVVLGTKKEYFEAVWVRNEWSRFLGHIKNGERKVLIPVYKDIDAYDLPQEFSNLQALNMERVGYLQDLISGVEHIVKLSHTNEENTNPAVTAPPNPPVLPKKKSKKPAIISVILIALAISIGAAVFTVLNQDKPPVDDDTINSGVDVEEDIGSVKNEKYSITVTAKDSPLPSDTKVDVKEIKSGTDYTTIKNALPKSVSKFQAFDISLSSNGKIVSPNGKVTVSVPLPSNISASKATVYYIPKSGAAEELDCTISKGIISFTTDHFSIYVIAEEQTAETDLSDSSTVESETVESETVETASGEHIHTVEIDKATEPTCTQTGLTEGSHCSVCGEVFEKQETIDALGHTEVADKAVAPTCAATGLTAGTHCSVCNTVLTAQQTVAKLPHVEVEDAAVAATCTSNGLTAGKHCSKCNAILVKQQTITAPGHTEVTDAAVAATCATTGLTAGKHCSVCGTVLVSQKTISKLSHTEVTDAAVAATCTETGLTAGKHCSKCQAILVQQKTLPALGHTEMTDSAVAPTCTEYGFSEGTHCTTCNAVIVEQEIIPAAGHKVITDHAVAATCTEDGLTDGSHCEVCKKVLVVQQVVSATGHDYCDYNDICLTCDEPVPFSEGLTYVEYEYDAYSNVVSYAVKGVGTCTDIDIYIPREYNGLPVVAIAKDGFLGSNIRSIRIHNGIKAIGSSAFYDCNDLTEIKIPDSVTSLGYLLCYNCDSLKNVIIGSGVTTLNHSSFEYCGSLKTLYITENLQSVPSSSYLYTPFYGSRLTTIYYTGTIAQWNESRKAENKMFLYAGCIIHCADGDITVG